VDGKPVTLYRTNLAMLGLAVPAGEHKVELTFQPLRWRVSLTISLVAAGVFVMLCLAWCAGRIRARRQASNSRR
jgi:uncharacterized membrane protein YfhO